MVQPLPSRSGNGEWQNACLADAPFIKCCCRQAQGGAMEQAGCMPWTPYADWIFTVVSTGSLLLIAWLVLRPRQ
jgi:hypothetical protein